MPAEDVAEGLKRYADMLSLTVTKLKSDASAPSFEGAMDSAMHAFAEAFDLGGYNPQETEPLIWTVQAESTRGWPPVRGTVHVTANNESNALHNALRYSDWSCRLQPGYFNPKEGQPFQFECPEDRRYALRPVPKGSGEPGPEGKSVWTVHFEVVPEDHRIGIWKGETYVISNSKDGASEKSHQTDIAKRQRPGDFKTEDIYPFQLSSERDRDNFGLALEPKDGEMVARLQRYVDELGMWQGDPGGGGNLFVCFKRSAEQGPRLALQALYRHFPELEGYRPAALEG